MYDDIGWQLWVEVGTALAWWGLFAAGLAMALKLRNSQSKGWLLYKLIMGVVLCQALQMSVYCIRAATFVPGSSFSAALYYAYIPFKELALSSFLVGSMVASHWSLQQKTWTFAALQLCIPMHCVHSVTKGLDAGYPPVARIWILVSKPGIALALVLHDLHTKAHIGTDAYYATH